MKRRRHESRSKEPRILYKEIRVENKLQDGDGNEVSLKPGAQVEVTIEADPQDTKPKEKAHKKSS